MSLAEEYRPCQRCGSLTDSGVCSSACANALDFLAEQKRRLALGEIDEEGRELGDYCSWCSRWFPNTASDHDPYCTLQCAIEAEGDE